MANTLSRARRCLLAASGAGTAFLLSGCDPSIRQTVEDGIITVSNSFLAALLRAFTELGQEEPENTVQAVVAPLLRLFA